MHSTAQLIGQKGKRIMNEPTATTSATEIHTIIIQPVLEPTMMVWHSHSMCFVLGTFLIPRSWPSRLVTITDKCFSLQNKFCVRVASIKVRTQQRHIILLWCAWKGMPRPMLICSRATNENFTSTAMNPNKHNEQQHPSLTLHEITISRPHPWESKDIQISKPSQKKQTLGPHNRP